MRVHYLCLLVLLGGCAATASPDEPLAGADIPCLQHQLRSGAADVRTAAQACDVDKPDLTGNGALQKLALDEHVPFEIRPNADRQLKLPVSTVTGSLIPEPAPVNSTNPDQGLFVGTLAFTATP